MIDKFTIECDGQIFECEREVTGKGALRQTVYVKDIGSRADTVVYGAIRHSASIINDVAQRIAREIINGS